MQKNRIFSGLVAAMLTFATCLPCAFAAPDAVAHNLQTYKSPTEQVLLEGDEPTYTPLSVEASELNGVRRVVKVYQVSPDLDPTELRESDFALDGYNYTYSDMSKQDTLYEDTKRVTQTYTLEGTSGDFKTILEALPETLPYTDDQGYKGEMELDIRSIETVESSHKTITTPHSQSITKTYTLDYNDPAEVPSSITDGGNTLNRVSLSWAGGDYVPESDTPAKFIATAVYSRSWTTSKTVVDGYTTTAQYEGTASVGGVDSVQYTITYVGTKIPLAPFLPAEIELPHVLIVGIGLLLVLIALIWRHIYVHLAKVYVPNEEKGVHQIVSRQYIRKKNPRVSLSQMQGHAKTEYVVVLHHRIAKKLIGRDIAIETGGEPQHIKVESFVGKDYSFHVTV